ncbi:hypothetical protein OQA88_12170 [Cercophora sp. LCS_1]
MFKNLTRPRPDDAAQAERDDDAISLTSTVDGPDDAEYEVKSILAESKGVDGDTYYLMLWEGFPIEDCTWEPEDNLGSALIEMWEETKQKHATGEETPFDVEIYNKAMQKKQKAKEERHRQRNAKRQRLGLPLTPPLLRSSRTDKHIVSDDEEDEAEEVGLGDNVSDSAPAEPSKRQRLTEALPKLTTSPTKASSKASSPVEPKGKSKTQSSSAVSKAQPSRPVKLSSAEAPQQGRSSSTSKSQGERPSSTGYQGTARKASGGISKPSVAPRGPGRPAVEAKLKAKKTGNIFSGGTTRKKRNNLESKMSDKTVEPKLFRNLSMTRKAELKGRNKEDIAPDPDKLVLFDLTKEKPSKKSAKSSTDDVSPISPGSQPFSPGVQHIASATTALKIGPDVPPKRNSKSVTEPKPVLKSWSSYGDPSAQPSSSTQPKRVRFLSPLNGEESQFVEEPEPMDIDDSAKVDAQRSRPHSPPPMSSDDMTDDLPSSELTKRVIKKMSLSDYSRIKSAQSSQKEFVLGSRPAIAVVFHGLPGESNAPWLMDFLTESKVEFHRTCIANNTGKMETLISSRLASGTVDAAIGESRLEKVAGFLRDSLAGLFCPRPSYNILVYPAKCDEWNVGAFRQEPTAPSDGILRYLIFASTEDCTAVLPPLPTPSPRAGSIPDGAMPKRQLIMDRIMGLDFARLLPSKKPLLNKKQAADSPPSPPPPNAFYIAFPEDRMSVGSSVCSWLRACDPECLIFVHDFRGSWQVFMEKTRSANAVVIVHESLVNSLRRIPFLSTRLVSRMDRYWCFAEPIRPRHVYPSMPVDDEELAPGDIHLTELFPDRTVILLTPSFLALESKRTLEILNWFHASIEHRGFRYKLATTHNVYEYLLHIAGQKSKARDDLKRHQSETDANLHGLSETDVKDAYKAANVVSEIQNKQPNMADPYGGDEESSCLICAPPCIDPNDEQSLVNWFGWWSMTRADQFRKFFVVGSTEYIGYPPGRRELTITIPRYSKATINNPDVVLEGVQQNTDESTPSRQGSLELSGPRNLAGDRPTQKLPQGLWALESGTERIWDARSIELEISRVKNDRSPHCTVYKFPVAWADMAMADHYDDFRQTFKRVDEWFGFTCEFNKHPQPPRNGPPKPTRYNTFLGFFYTPMDVDEWDPSNPPRGNLQRRHPWVAIYRVWRPHLPKARAAGGCELILWDPSTNEKYPGYGSVKESDLIYMQRRVIRHVVENTGTVNPGSTIKAVWIGCGSHRDDKSDSPFERAIKQLVWTAKSPEAALPATDFELESAGYRRVVAPTDSRPGGTGSDVDVAMDTGDSDEGSESEDDSVRIIFHPPRATRLSPGAKTICTNRLYEEARLARAGRNAATMKYTFVPTTEWYKDQEVEGRDFKHITVDHWPAIFSPLRIGAQKTTIDPTGQRRDSIDSS